MTGMDEIIKLRLTLVANGYVPLANRSKVCFLTDWPRLAVDEALILRWGRRFRRDKATGIRVEDYLAVIDFDIDHPVINVIVNRILDEIPELADETKPLLVRHGKGLKEAWFVRTAELFGRLQTHSWIAPGSSADDATHSVECFGGASARQFGAFGSHSIDDAGNVLVSYRWRDRSPADTPKSELPVLKKGQLARILDIAEEEFEKAGFTPVERSSKGESASQRVYDLTEEMFFDCNDGVTRTLAELQEMARLDTIPHGLRCSASWLEGPSAKNTERCLIGRAATGSLTIWESRTCATHMVKPIAVNRNKLNEMLRQIGEISHGRR
jgi:hypothetical protein